MKKNIKNLIMSFSLGISSILLVHVIKSCFIQEEVLDFPEKQLIATITGAVKNPGSYLFEKNQTIREIIFKANVKNSADIFFLSLDSKQIESFDIFIPYKIGEKPKLKYSEIETINQLKAIGIKDNVAKAIIKYKNENKGIPTWKEIDDLPGIGEKTLAYLKENIELF